MPLQMVVYLDIMFKIDVCVSSRKDMPKGQWVLILCMKNVELRTCVDTQLLPLFFQEKADRKPKKMPSLSFNDLVRSKMFYQGN